MEGENDLRLLVTDGVYGEGPVKIRCINPYHDDPNASMAVYRDNIHCFGCNFHRNDYDTCVTLLTSEEARKRIGAFLFGGRTYYALYPATDA